MTKSQAVARAEKLAKHDGEERFVVFDPQYDGDRHHYNVARYEDFDAYYLGISESDILYSTVDGWY